MAEEIKVAEESKETGVPKKKNSLLLIGGIVLGVVVLFGAVLGYGFINGSMIRSYGVFAEKTYSVTMNWDKAFDDTDLATVKENVAKLKSESDTALVALKAKSAPTKAKKLKADLTEYFTLSKRVATETESIVEWATEMEKVGTATSALSGLDTSSPAAMATSIDKAKVDLDASIARLEKLSVPESMKAQDTAFKKMLTDLSVLYGRLSVALRANDMNALSTITSEFTNSCCPTGKLK
jgi:hypothetical protein